MKKLLLVMFFAISCLFVKTPSAQAYFGFSTGLVNNDEYGYGMNFGFYTPANLGMDIQIIGNRNDELNYTQYAFQENMSLFYDFNSMLKSKNEKFSETHPFVKLGFSYGTNVLSAISVSGAEFATRFSDGPGVSFGLGCDWKMAQGFSIGVDLFESILWVDGATAGGQVLVPDETQYGFNLLVAFKFYDIMSL